MISTVDSITIDWDQRPVSCTLLLPQRGEVLLKNLNLQIFTESSCRRRPVSRERSQQRWNLDPGLRRDDGVFPRLVTAQRGEVLAMTNDHRLLKINTCCACVDRVAEVLWIP
jgi:hypothetical protein